MSEINDSELIDLVSSDDEDDFKISGKAGGASPEVAPPKKLGALSKKKNVAKKAKMAPKFSIVSSDPFQLARDKVLFIVRGAPLPQERDRPGWNGNRYNPSKPAQNEFRKIVANFISTAKKGTKLHFGNQPLIVTCDFRFPLIVGKKNCGDIDNLLKFTFDALQDCRIKQKTKNGCTSSIEYGLFRNDANICRVIADKDIDDAFGGSGFTKITVEIKPAK